MSGPEARRAIAGINHGATFRSYFTPQLDIRGVKFKRVGCV
jgi:hypothetical protein